MKKHFVNSAVFFPATALIILLSDPKTAIAGASLGLDSCIKAVVPALFPFFVISSLLTSTLSQESSAFLAPLGKLCAIPKGQEGLFLMGILCGYPVGAQNIYSAYSVHRLDRDTARRLLGFCSNAGPSFIFGVTSMLFTESYIPWILWGIQIFSAIIVGILLPGRKQHLSSPSVTERISLPEALSQSIRALANVCGWVILFRSALEILNRRLFSCVPEVFAVMATGLLELTNGCIALQKIPEEGLRFVLCSFFLSTGGLCVLMQTISVAKDLGVRTYISGKIFQGTVSILLASILRYMLFPNESTSLLMKGIISCSTALLCLLIIFCCRKKEVAFSEKVLYNGENAA